MPTWLFQQNTGVQVPLQGNQNIAIMKVTDHYLCQALYILSGNWVASESTTVAGRPTK